MEPLLSSDPSNVGAYRLLGRLGGGGMGVVYLAEDAEHRRVAVKLLSGGPGMGPQLRERLAREARSLQLLSSPHVVRVIDVDVQAEVPFLVMSYAEGLPLDRSVPEGGLAPQWAREFGAQLAGALADVHAHGVVHRDLKPNNVILGASGVTLVDFGIASLEEEGVTALTRDGGFMGSLAWLAPEVIAGASADERSDVFGLGLLLGFMALGRHPYGGGRPEAVMYRIMHERPDLDGVDPMLAAVVSAALRRDPEARPSAAELAAALHAPGEVVLPRPAARGGRSRNGVRLALAGVVAAAVAGAVVVATTAGGSAAPSAAPSSSPEPAAPASATPEAAASASATPEAAAPLTATPEPPQPEPARPSPTPTPSPSLRPVSYTLCNFDDPSVPKPNSTYPLDAMLTEATGLSSDPDVVTAVRSIQEVLLAEGFTGPQGQTMVVDGDYGSWTAAAVRKFQQQAGITVDGKVGPETWYAMSTNSCWKYH